MVSGNTRSVECVFYSHVWVVQMLEKLGVARGEATVLVELAETSTLAPVFGEQGKARHGLAGLLHPGGRLDKLAARLDGLPAPLLLAPRPEVPATALCSAVGVLGSTPGVFRRAVLLVHVNDAPRFAAAYPQVDRFRVLWDLADIPTGALVRLAEVLVAQHCVSEERWGGFGLYEHPRRAVADGAVRRAGFETLLGEYPGLVGEAV